MILSRGFASPMIIKALVDDFVELRGQSDVGIYWGRVMSCEKRNNASPINSMLQSPVGGEPAARQLIAISHFLCKKSCFIMIAVHLANALWLAMSMLKKKACAEIRIS